MLRRLFGFVENLGHFLRVGIWRMRLRDLGGLRSFTIRQVRVVLLAFRGFDEDRCQLRASALTFYTLFSIVPIVGVAFAAAKGYRFEEQFEARLRATFPQPEQAVVIEKIIGFSKTLVEQVNEAKGGVIAGIGVLVLLWSVVNVLGNIERSFNEICGAKRGRSLARRFSDYVAVMVIAPIVLIASGSATVVAKGFVEDLIVRFSMLQAFRPVIEIGLRTIPFVLLITFFTFIYVFVPNVKVRLSSALLAGVVTGALYQLVQWTYISSQMVVSKYNAVYGSFSVLPLFLLWVQISWLIVLLGAEIAFAHQNVETYEFERDCLTANPAIRKRAALGIVHLCVKNFMGDGKALTAAQISEETLIPIRLVRDLTAALVETNVLSETRTAENDDPAYQPARDLDQITIQFVFKRMDAHGTDHLHLPDSEGFRKIGESLDLIGQEIEKSKGNIKLKMI